MVCMIPYRDFEHTEVFLGFRVEKPLDEEKKDGSNDDQFLETQVCPSQILEVVAAAMLAGAPEPMAHLLGHRTRYALGMAGTPYQMMLGTHGGHEKKATELGGGPEHIPEEAESGDVYLDLILDW